jgi:hypothetical protein
MKLVVVHEVTPIPDRRFDWCCYDDDTYDGTPGQPIGYGATREEAINNFLAELEAAEGGE